MPQQENWQPTGPHATRMSPQIHYRHTRHGIARNQFSSLMDQTKCLTKFSKRVYRLEFDLAVIEDFLRFAPGSFHFFLKICPDWYQGSPALIYQPRFL